MKTNHRRGFIAKSDPTAEAGVVSAKLSDGTRVMAFFNGHSVNGNQGRARAKSGAKRRLHSLSRMADKRLTKNGVEE